MWFGRGTRFLLSRGEYREISTGPVPALLIHADGSRPVGLACLRFRTSALFSQARCLSRRAMSADPCKRRRVVTRELSILRGTLARGPPSQGLISLSSRMDLRNLLQR